MDEEKQTSKKKKAAESPAKAKASEPKAKAAKATPKAAVAKPKAATKPKASEPEATKAEATKPKPIELDKAAGQVKAAKQDKVVEQDAEPPKKAPAKSESKNESSRSEPEKKPAAKPRVKKPKAKPEPASEVAEAPASAPASGKTSAKDKKPAAAGKQVTASKAAAEKPAAASKATTRKSATDKPAASKSVSKKAPAKKASAKDKTASPENVPKKDTETPSKKASAKDTKETESAKGKKTPSKRASTKGAAGTRRPAAEPTPARKPASEPVAEPVGKIDFAAIETPAELMPRHSASETVGAAAPGGGLLGAAASAAAEPDTKGEAEAEGLVPALKRDRPIRQPVIPRKVWLTVSIVVAVLVLGTVGGLFGRAQSRINVPDVLGRSEEEAKTLLTQIGLEAGISGSRFSAEPKGTVLGQSPAPGARLARGSVIELIVSAGTEEVVMPDVVGDGIASAREALDGLGLALEIELVSSELASGTVLLTTPSPGVILTTGDVVYVQVATPTVREEGLKPYSLEGVIVVIDPGSPPTGAPDTAMEVSRRLRALLEASGASTWLLRSGVATNMPEAERAASARVATATVGIGISMATTGEGGRTVMVVSGAGTVSQTLAQTLTEQLNAAVSPAVQVPSSIDPVFSGQEYAALRIGIGALDSGSDRSSFIDPKWADRVAQAIYTGLGEVFGERQQP